jgi:pimeloyl-ACP methyl ester carboxylesterase
MPETDVAREGRSLRARDTGDPDGKAVLYFHATPGSRLDLAFADELAASVGVRLVSFDRPGYGGSTPASYTLASIARDAGAVADALGIDSFATLGQSGGGPFSLAAGAVLPGRVTRVGVAAGGGPFDKVPGALDALDDNDRQALALLPHDVDGAARGFAAGFEPLVSLFRESAVEDVVRAFHDSLSTRDREIVDDTRLATALGTSMKESLRQGASGGGWDNVAWVGPWDIDPATITAPVLLWYGGEDRFCSPAHGAWLRDHVPDARLVLREAEGHLGFMEHTEEMLLALTTST